MNLHPWTFAAVHVRPVHAFWAVAISLVIACSPTVPSVAPATPDPTKAPVGSPEPPPTGLPSPSVACDSPPVIEGLSVPIPACELAVEAALAALSDVHPAIASISFRYGHYCPPGYYCALALPPAAHVIVTYADGGQLLISMLGEESGDVTVTNFEPIPTDEPTPRT